MEEREGNFLSHSCSPVTKIQECCAFELGGSILPQLIHYKTTIILLTVILLFIIAFETHKETTTVNKTHEFATKTEIYHLQNVMRDKLILIADFQTK